LAGAPRRSGSIHNDEDSEEEDDYEYEVDDDDAPFHSGFLVDTLTEDETTAGAASSAARGRGGGDGDGPVAAGIACRYSFKVGQKLILWPAEAAHTTSESTPKNA
jgi:hypothetical protein